MEALFDRLVNQAMADIGTRQLLNWAMQNFYAFTLVLVRMSGLMTAGPLFGTPMVPPNVRVLLVLVMSILITPALLDHSRVAFHRFDGDHDGRLTRDEVPPHLQEHFDRLLANATPAGRTALTENEFYHRPSMPSTVLDFAWTAGNEFVLGFVLGFGVMIIMSGLQLAGELLDQQSGIAMGEVVNPGFEINGSISGQFLFLLGITVFVCMEPMGGHLLVISALVETFQTLPIGEAQVSFAAYEVLRDLVHQSLVLAIQVAAPMLATMALVALAMGFLGHTVPQINVLVIGFPIRVSINLVILTLSFSGIGRAVVDYVPLAIDQLRFVLANPG